MKSATFNSDIECIVPLDLEGEYQCIRDNLKQQRRSFSIIKEAMDYSSI